MNVKLTVVIYLVRDKITPKGGAKVRIPKPDRILDIQCPVCSKTIIWNVDENSDQVECSVCHAVIEVPTSTKAEAEQFKALSDAFMKK